MTDYVKINVSGLEQLQRELSDFSVKIQRTGISNANRAAAKVILKETKARCPVDTGTLRDSFRIVRAPRLTGDRYLRHWVTPTRSKGSKKVAWYAHLVEYATGEHLIGVKSKKVLAEVGRSGVVLETYGTRARHPGTPAKGFMRRSFDATADMALSKYQESLRRFIVRKHTALEREDAD